MGFSGELGLNIAEMHLRGPLKPIYTNSGEAAMRGGDDDDDNDVINAEEEDQCGGSTTPTARIPIRLTCPPPPRKKKQSSSKCNYFREFFTPPDLESVFILRQHVERSN